MLEYIVREGDTLQRIAMIRGLKPENILNANPWASDQPYLVPGQILFIPSTPRRRYAIQSGDTLASVLEQFSITEHALEGFNPGISHDRFPVGRILVLPSSDKMSIVEPQGEYGYRDMMKHITELLGKYKFIEANSIGESVMGKSLEILKIGKGKRIIHVNASIHANEWMTTLCVMRFVEEYAEAYQNQRMWNGYNPQEWFDNCTLWVLPMANPDGVELVQEGATPTHPFYAELMEYNSHRRDFKHWKANIQGVDLGDQFPAHWEEEVIRRGKNFPSPRDYAGTSPLSEPESKALVAFTLDISPDAVISLHSQGQEIYWNYRDYEPEISEKWSQRLAQVSGYRSVKLQGSDAGYKDWFIQHFKRPGFTVEIGQGVNPLPLHDYRNLSLEVGLIVGELMSF